MAWVVVPALEDLRLQLDAVAPDRDKTSDGGIGDTSHAAGKSSHNPDRTGNPEYRDGDSADEVRARDFDRDLNHPDLTMLEFVRHLVLGARAGRFWWLRYVIYQGVIYHKSTGWAARAYTGANQHDHHAHVNNDFTQAADAARGVNYHLEDLVALTDADKKWMKDNLGPAKVWAEPLEDPASTATPKKTKPAREYLRYNDVVNKTTADRAAASLLTAIQSGRVDTVALAAALAPAVAAQVVAQLPDGADAVSQDEVNEAVRSAFAEAFGPRAQG